MAIPSANAQRLDTLRAAVAWALQIADDLEQNLIATHLATALSLTEGLVEAELKFSCP